MAVLSRARRGDADERYAMRDAVSPRATAARRLGAADPAERLDLSITLRLRDADGLAALLAAQQDPGSPQYHRWLTPEQFAARFAPAPETYAAVVDWLGSEGFTVRPKVNAARVDFSGDVARIEDCFGVRMGHYEDRGRTLAANESPPLLPIALRDAVDVVRLNTFPLAEPSVRLTDGTQTFDAMAPSDMAAAYGIRALHDAGTTGAQQTIAVVARSDFASADVAQFQTQFGVPGRAPLKVFPTTNPGVGAPNGVCRGIRNSRQLAQCLQGEQTEVLLDTEWASALAPAATVLVDISGADIDVSLMDIVTTHPEATVITMSFGACERLDSGDLRIFAPLYAQAAAQGQTVLVSSGDGGADGCQDGMGRSVNVLASDATVTAVGGTTLDPGFDASGHATGHVGETAWNNSAGASGGGASQLVAKPAYQSAPGVPADGARDQPDVSLLADPNGPGYVVVVAGAIDIVGGTSAAAPSWAGIVALLDQQQGQALGALNPLLYELGRQQYGAAGTPVFHDVTQGDNAVNGVAGYAAGVGYDLVSGLGTPDVAALAAAIGAALATPTGTAPPTETPTATSPPTRTATPTVLATRVATPTATPTGTATSAVTATMPPLALCAGDCNGDGVVEVNEVIQLVDLALGSAADCSTCRNGIAPGEPCPSAITIAVLVEAVRHALDGCAA